MTSKIPIGIFPYRAELLPLVRNFEQLQEKYELKKIWTFRGASLANKDVAYACNHPQLALMAEVMNDTEDIEIEKLIVSIPPTMNKQNKEQTLKLVDRFNEKGKRTDIFFDDWGSNKTSLYRLARKHPSLLNLYPEETILDLHQSAAEMRYRKIETPIIFVGGLIENPDTTEIVCNIKSRFERDGVNCLVYCKHSIMALFGFHSIMPLLTANSIPVEQRIEFINFLANSHVEKKRPDLIIVEAPDGVLRFNDNTPNGFGINSYILAQAFQPDFFICNIPFEFAKFDLISLLSKDFELRFNTRLVAIHSSNIVLDSAENIQTHTLSYVHVPVSHVDEDLSKLSNWDVPVFNIIVDKNSLYSYLRNLLSVRSNGN
mgnify:CR=1 FL=1